MSDLKPNQKRIKVKKERKKFPSVFDFINMKSKKARWVVRIALLFFVLFFVTAIMETLQNLDDNIIWWILTVVSGCIGAGTIVFCSDFTNK